MATPNIVPRADSEGGIGTATKYWASAYIDLIYLGAGKIGRDADNLIDFSVDNNIVFKVNGVSELQLNATEFFPYASNGLSLGNSGRMWSDLFLASGAVINFDNGNVTLTHSANALTLADNDKLNFGTGSDLEIYHEPSNGIINNKNGHLYVKNTAADRNVIFELDNGAGSVTSYLTLDGANGRVNFDIDAQFADGKKMRVGDGADLQLFHSSNESHIYNQTGNLTISNDFEDGDIIFKSDNGSNGLAEYFRLDGGEGRTVVAKAMRFNDSTSLQLGSGADIQMHHDGSNGFFNNITGDFTIKNTKQDKDIIFQADNGAASDNTVATYFYLDGSSATHDGSATTALYTNWPDLSRISLGTSHDLQVYHDGSDSFITESGTGDLKISSSSIIMLKPGLGEFLAKFIPDGAVELYHDGSKKFETTATGVTVTGGLTATNTSSTVHSLAATNNNTRSTLSVKSKDSSGNSVDLRMHSLEGGRGELFTLTNHPLGFATNNAAPQMLLDTNGRLGIGTTSPQKALDISAAITAGGGVLRLSGTGNGSQNDQTGAIEFFSADTTDNSPGVFAKIRGVAHASGGEGSLQFVVDMPSEGADASTIAMHVNPDGKVGVGVIAPASLLHVAGTVQVGVDDTGHDVKFFGATASVFLHWDESADRLIFTDNAFLAIGSSSDLLVYHDASNSHILNSTGNFHITNNQDDGDIVFKTSTGSATAATYLTLDGSATNMKADTDMIFADNKALMLGTGGDAFFKHDGSNFSFINDVGNVTFTNRTDDGDIIFQSDDGGGGVETYFFLDGSSTGTNNPMTIFPDGSKLGFGSQAVPDLLIYHDGSNSYITDNGTGDLISHTNRFFVKSTAGEAMFRATENGACELFHNNVSILSTTTTGIDVTGVVKSTSATGTAEGGGIDASDAVSIQVGEYNSEIITNIFVDLGAGSIISTTTDGGILGNDGEEAPFITRITKAVNGVVYRGELICLEAPTASANVDIDLSANSSGTLAAGADGNATILINSGGAHTVGRMVASTFAVTDNDFLYLTQSGTTNGTYGAGKLLIKLYGAKTAGL